MLDIQSKCKVKMLNTYSERKAKMLDTNIGMML